MAIGATLFIVIALIILIWVFIEIKRFRHKFFAVFLVILILFTYLSFTLVLKGKNVDWKSPSGMVEASKLYFSWLGSLFGNAKSITSHAISLDWKGNETG
ncbi:MAG: hypothetical protein AABW50_05635 [Nanoarchaeota archaeon]